MVTIDQIWQSNFDVAFRHLTRDRQLPVEQRDRIAGKARKLADTQTRKEVSPGEWQRFTNVRARNARRASRQAVAR